MARARGIQRGRVAYVVWTTAPGVAEASIGKERTNELAVMIDTFRPLVLTAAAEGFDDPGYPTSWLP